MRIGTWIEDRRRDAIERLADGRVLLLLGAVTLGACLAASPAKGTWSIADGPRAIGEMLRGRGWLGDVAQDVVGFRRLVERGDPYPVLGPALREIGVDWPIDHASTHPPTAYLLAAPIAYLPLGLAGQVWCLAGFGLLFLAMVGYGIPWKPALGLSLLAPLWKPAAASFHNLTFLWLAGVALAYRCRNGGGMGSGIGIGLASLSKLLPAGITLYFLRLGKWRAAGGVFVAWSVAVAILLLLAPGALSAYVSPEVRQNAWATVLRPDNAALARQAHALGGIGGLIGAATFLLVLLARNRRELLWPALAPEYAFFLYSYLAVALLPIAWGYSATPLLPVLGFFLVRGGAWHVVLAMFLLLSFGILPTFGPHAAIGVLGTSLLFFFAPPSLVARAQRSSGRTASVPSA